MFADVLLEDAPNLPDGHLLRPVGSALQASVELNVTRLTEACNSLANVTPEWSDLAPQKAQLASACRAVKSARGRVPPVPQAIATITDSLNAAAHREVQIMVGRVHAMADPERRMLAADQILVSEYDNRCVSGHSSLVHPVLPPPLEPHNSVYPPVLRLPLSLPFPAPLLEALVLLATTSSVKGLQYASLFSVGTELWLQKGRHKTCVQLTSTPGRPVSALFLQQSLSCVFLDENQRLSVVSVTNNGALNAVDIVAENVSAYTTGRNVILATHVNPKHSAEAFLLHSNETQLSTRLLRVSCPQSLLPSTANTMDLSTSSSGQADDQLVYACPPTQVGHRSKFGVSLCVNWSLANLPADMTVQQPVHCLPDA